MIKFYTLHCPNCLILERLMKNKGIEFEKIEDNNVVMSVAKEHGIMTIPFADVDGQIMNSKDFIKYINK